MKTLSTISASAAIVLMLVVAPGATQRVQAQESPAAITDKSAAGELAYWNQIKDSNNAADFKSYLENFPDGMFAEPALRRFEQAGGNRADLSAPVLKATTAEPDVQQSETPEPAPVVSASKAKSKSTVTRKVTKAKVTKAKSKRIVKASKRAKPVAGVKVRKSKPRVNAVRQAPVCKTGRLVNGRCVVNKRRPTGGGGGNSSGGGGWGGGGGNGGGGNGGGGGGWGG